MEFTLYRFDVYTSEVDDKLTRARTAGVVPDPFAHMATAGLALFSRDYELTKKSKPEWGLNLSHKNYPLLAAFSFDKRVNTLASR